MVKQTDPQWFIYRRQGSKEIREFSGKYKCSQCDSDNFNVFWNVWSEELMKDIHLEIVCNNCRYGCLVKPCSLQEEK